MGIIATKQFSILCVDDDEIVLEWLKTGLEPFGYAVEVAQNGFTALGRIRKRPHHFAILMVDLRMPGMDGFSVIEESRAAGFEGKVIVYAGAITPDARDRLRELRVSCVIEKPARRADLVTAIKEAQSGF